MTDAAVDRIMKIVETEWEKTYENDLDRDLIVHLRNILRQCPHEDGCQRIYDTISGNTYKVPLEDIILKGLKRDDLINYPVVG